MVILFNGHQKFRSNNERFMSPIRTKLKPSLFKLRSIEKFYSLHHFCFRHFCFVTMSDYQLIEIANTLIIKIKNWHLLHRTNPQPKSPKNNKLNCVNLHSITPLRPFTSGRRSNTHFSIRSIYIYTNGFDTASWSLYQTQIQHPSFRNSSCTLLI